MSKVSCILLISFLMTKVEAPCLLESDPAGLRAKPCTEIPAVRNAKAIPADPILFARDMASPWAGPDDEPSERNRLLMPLFEDHRSAGPKRCLRLGRSRSERGAGRLVWRANCPT